MATTVPCREADPLPPGVVSISGKVAVKAAPVRSCDVIIAQHVRYMARHSVWTYTRHDTCDTTVLVKPSGKDKAHKGRAYLGHSQTARKQSHSWNQPRSDDTPPLDVIEASAYQRVIPQFTFLPRSMSDLVLYGCFADRFRSNVACLWKLRCQL